MRSRILKLGMLTLCLCGVIGATPRTYSTTHKFLFIGSVQSGLLKSASGGSLAAEAITIQFGLNMSKPLYDWINTSMRGDATRLKGAIVTCNSSFEPMNTQSFVDALIMETTFPALDAASKDQAALTVRFQPTSDTVVQGSDLKTVIPTATKQKIWLASSFKVSIAGLPGAGISRVEPLTVRQSGSVVTPSSIVVLLPSADAGPWTDWRQQFVKAGTSTLGLEKAGEITWLAADGITVLGKLKLGGLGISKLEEVTGTDGVSLYQATMSCKSVVLTVVQ